MTPGADDWLKSQKEKKKKKETSQEVSLFVIQELVLELITRDGGRERFLDCETGTSSPK